MFKKLLKYDIRSIKKAVVIITIAVIAAAIIGSMMIRGVVGNLVEDSIFIGRNSFITVALTMGGTLGGVFSIFGIVTALSVFGILVLYRFYKNFYTDEGYLTFTLPVSRKMLLWEKIVFTLICEAVILVLSFVAVNIYAVLCPIAEDGNIVNFGIYRLFGELIERIYEGVGMWIVLWLFELLVFIFILSAAAFSLAYYCITLGAIVAKKYKLLAAIGIYYGVNAGLSLVGNILFSTSMVSTVSIFDAVSTYLSRLNINGICAVFSLVFAIVIMACGAFFTIFFNATLKKIETRLNLA